ncbi:ankyrin repeat domain-containing protein [Burkholderia contaminans]|uniref:ankyrin repeat domain-containing protein n=1 Tax=Burkholderia contaminans TaxID=488447 RepID=UPI00158E6E53|nr:ankyrin repeat domain-containing protein [Burkholderia contaminans]
MDKDQRIQYDIIYENIYLAAARGDLDSIKECVEAGADRLGKNNALNECVEHGHIEIAKYLLEHGANIHSQKERALRIALDAGQLDMAIFLVEQGSDIHSVKEEALIGAARKAHYPIMRYLLSLGTDPKLDFRTAPEEVKEWMAQYINSSTLNDKLQNSLPEKEDKPASKVNNGKL